MPTTHSYLMAGHLTMCALHYGQEHQVLVPWPHVQWHPSYQTTLQEASTHQVRARHTGQQNPGEKAGPGLLIFKISE